MLPTVRRAIAPLFAIQSSVARVSELRDVARSCRTHRQDCSTWHSDSSKDHRRRRNRCRNFWLFCKKPATATSGMHGARWASRNARPEASSLGPRLMCSWIDSVTASRIQTSRSKSRRGGATPDRRCSATLPRSTSPWSSVVVAAPWSSRSCRAGDRELPGLHRFMTNAHQSGTVGGETMTKELVDSGSLLGDWAALRERIASSGYVFVRGLLSADMVRAVGRSGLRHLQQAGWTSPDDAAGDVLVFHCLTTHVRCRTESSG